MFYLLNFFQSPNMNQISTKGVSLQLLLHIFIIYLSSITWKTRIIFITWKQQQIIQLLNHLWCLYKIHNLHTPLPGYIIRISKENHMNLLFFTNASNKFRNFGIAANRTRGREEVEKIQAVKKYFVPSPPFAPMFKAACEVSP